VKAAALLLGVAVLAPACSTGAPLSRRGDSLRGVLAASVQLRAERPGVRRFGSGVVVAADAASGRSWIITTRHLFQPGPPQQLWVTTTGGGDRLRAVVRATSTEVDLAIVEVAERALPTAILQDRAHLGDEVRVVTFPWGRRLTVVGGIVSQIASEDGEIAVEGAVRMIDASVSYGASGGGVFDAVSGTLLGIVESYRTARVALPTEPEKVLDLPVAGETTVVGAPAIRRFLQRAGVSLPE
jgi:serine protease Do